MNKIEIPDFISIKILELYSEKFIYFVDSYNEKYFYINNDNKLCIYHLIYTYYDLYFQKARIVHRNNLDKLKKYVYKLYRQLTFKIPRAEKDATYFIITRNFKVAPAIEINDFKDDNQYEEFNYFLSKEEAEKYAKKLQTYLIESRKEEYCNE